MLKGKTILIGKEPGNGRLLLAVKDEEVNLTTTIGDIGSVPNSVSRCKPTEDVAHCKLSIEMDGTMVLTNLRPQNVTYVNGQEIMTKRVMVDSAVALGKDRYAVNLKILLEKAQKLVEQHVKKNPQKLVVSIKHLEPIWEQYDAMVLNLQIEERKQTNQRMILSILSPLGVISLFLPIWLVLRLTISVISLGLAIFFYLRGRSVKNFYIVKKHEIDNRFAGEYVCPNRDCGHYLGIKPYKILLQDKKCRFCGCKYSEND